MGNQKLSITPGEKASNNLILTLHFNHKLTDDFIPPNVLQFVLEKPFSAWPKELQDKLRPLGAALIE